MLNGNGKWEDVWRGSAMRHGVTPASPSCFATPGRVICSSTERASRR